MDSGLIGDVFRVVNIALALVYIPLLYKRVQHVQHNQVLHATGDGLITLAVVVGSYSLFNVHFVPSQPMVTATLVIWIVTSFRNDQTRRRRQRG